MLEESDTTGMRTFCETLHPATVAESLADDFAPDQVWRFLEQTGIRDQAAVFEYFPIDMQVKLVEGTGRPHMARLIEQMSHDDRAALLRRLMPRVAESLLRLVDEADRRDMATLAKFEEDTAGALMTTDYAWLPAHITVSDALDRLRLQAPDKETIYYVYVLDERRKLLGVVSLRDLILAPRHAVLRDIMGKEVVSVKVTDDREQVAQVMARFDLLAIPVVDDEGRLVGIVTHDDVMDVVVEEATEDVHRMGAVGPLEENYLEAPFTTIWRNRAFWLSCLFAAELFTFTALSFFEDAIAEMVVLSLFVPLCISTGGNSGSQAATLITRAIALGQVEIRKLSLRALGRSLLRGDLRTVFAEIRPNAGAMLRVLRHELLLGIALGLTLGTIGFFRGWFTPEEMRKNPTVRREAFQIKVPQDQPLVVDEADRTVQVRPGLVLSITEQHPAEVSLPDNANLKIDRDSATGYLLYQFPEKCTIRHEAVSRRPLAWVIALAVAGICLWGTLVGSLLPIIFKSLGADPGIASSPFVATFVDVTGIIIYFTVAKTFLL